MRGSLAGGQGGEQIVVSARPRGGTQWREQVVIAGANQGRFTADFRITGATEFVARWAGDSGRRGLGTKVSTLVVRR